MADPTRHILTPDASIKQAAEALESAVVKIVLIVDQAGKLVGTVTDGDLRRAVIRGVSFSDPVLDVVNRNPRVMPVSSAKDEIIAVMKKEHIRQMPLVDSNQTVVDIVSFETFSEVGRISTPVVIMAGGEGKRLRPLTETVPKPMLNVDESPILEILINRFLAQGFYNFYISVNYHASIIKEHFGNGTRFGVNIHYLEETNPLGTAGSLSLIEEELSESIIVINGDILTTINFRNLLSFHHEHASKATMGVCEHDVQIPYGVVDIEDYNVHNFIEKPIQKFFVNAGLYVLEPEVIALVKKNESIDMPVLFELAKELNYTTAAFPIREFWLDIGRMEDYKKAAEEYKKLKQSIEK